MGKEQLYNKYVYIDTPEMWSRVQLAMFKLGLRWNSGEQRVSTTPRKYIGVWDDDCMTQTNSPDSHRAGWSEVTAAFVFSLILDKPKIKKAGYRIP